MKEKKVTLETNIFYYLFFYLFVCNLGSAIKCYVCQSKLDPNCAGNLPKNPPADHPAAKYFLECPKDDPNGPQTFCRKQEQDSK